MFDIENTKIRFENLVYLQANEYDYAERSIIPNGVGKTPKLALFSLTLHNIYNSEIVRKLLIQFQ